ncbi:MAG: serine hydrolase [Anaerolineaceae bacterium]|nr:serine hydrolase [Anaerolineaceae bacterium]
MVETTIQKTLQNVEKYLLDTFNEEALAGLAVGVVHQGDLVLFKGLGRTNISQDTAVNEHSVFRIGSISKTFINLALMQLYEQGKFQLDDPVNNYLKTYQVLHDDPQAPPVTFRHMMTHTSGIGETRTNMDVMKALISNKPKEIGQKPGLPLPDLGTYYSGKLTPEVYPGQKWAYANHAYATLGQLIEDISGMPFGEYVRENIFKPLGMERTDFFMNESLEADLAVGYQPLKKGKFQPVDFLNITIPAAGSVFSSVHEMSRYMAALMNKGENAFGKIFKPETLELMMTPQLDLDSGIFNMGLTYWVYDYAGHRVINHDGGWPGFVSSMFVAPDDEYGVIVFTNTMDRCPNRISSTIMRKLLNIPEPVENTPAAGVLESPHDWPALMGYYGSRKGVLTNARLWMSFGNEIQVYIKDNHLALRGLVGPLAKGFTLHRVDQKDAMLYRGVIDKTAHSVRFLADEKGKITGIQFAQNEFFKRPFQESLRARVMAVLGVVGGLILFLCGRKISRKK